MTVPASTKQHVADHLGQAEFALRVASNFECLRGTPAHEAVLAALARVADAKVWAGVNLVVPKEPAGFQADILSWRERHRAIRRRLARLAP